MHLIIFERDTTLHLNKLVIPLKQEFNRICLNDFGKKFKKLTGNRGILNYNLRRAKEKLGVRVLTAELDIFIFNLLALKV